MIETPRDVETDAQVVQGGMDSLAWLLNNAHNHDLPTWDGLVKAAREDRGKAMEALDRILAELQQAQGDKANRGKMLDATIATLQERTAELAQVKDALAPFAAVSVATEWMPYRDNTALWSGDVAGGETVRILLADVDRARAALEGTDQ